MDYEKMNQVLSTRIEELEAEIQKLNLRVMELDALEQSGVDNWEWYGEAMNLYRKWTD